jgi:hypothetical protein
MSDSKFYVGNLKPATKKYGNALLKGSISIETLKAILDNPEVQELVYEYEGNHYLNIKVVQRKKPDQFGRTHYIEVDTYVREEKPEEAQTAPKRSKAKKSE